MMEKSAIGRIDGFLVQSILCFAFGIFWLTGLGAKALDSLHNTKLEMWIVGRKLKLGDFTPLPVQQLKSEGPLTELELHNQSTVMRSSVRKESAEPSETQSYCHTVNA